MYEQWNPYLFILPSYAVAVIAIFGYALFCYLFYRRVCSCDDKKVQSLPLDAEDKR